MAMQVLLPVGQKALPAWLSQHSFGKENDITGVITRPNPTWCTGYLKFPSYRIRYTKLLLMLQQNITKIKKGKCGFGSNLTSALYTNWVVQDPPRHQSGEFNFCFVRLRHPPLLMAKFIKLKPNEIKKEMESEFLSLCYGELSWSDTLYLMKSRELHKNSPKIHEML